MTDREKELIDYAAYQFGKALQRVNPRPICASATVETKMATAMAAIITLFILYLEIAPEILSRATRTSKIIQSSSL